MRNKSHPMFSRKRHSAPSQIHSMYDKKRSILDIVIVCMRYGVDDLHTYDVSAGQKRQPRDPQ